MQGKSDKRRAQLGTHSLATPSSVRERKLQVPVKFVDASSERGVAARVGLNRGPRQDKGPSLSCQLAWASGDCEVPGSDRRRLRTRVLVGPEDLGVG